MYIFAHATRHRTAATTAMPMHEVLLSTLPYQWCLLCITILLPWPPCHWVTARQCQH